MQVFKFGGASVKNAENIKNIVSIIEKHQDSPLLIVVSAIGKSTNKLVEITQAYVNQTGDYFELLETLKKEHFQLLTELFPDASNPVFDEVMNTFVEIEWILEEQVQDHFTYVFDQIVSICDIVYSKIVAAYANIH